ncbi:MULTISPECIES: flagellar filament capping protein FliD [Providencia]|uniref:Flagellar hook-associated protein 2 n=1 Tax=Providencia stuartii TaxID=588 RepID=A0ABD5L087_PROST|nr:MULTISPECIES: flagellar filament capping protein FliD [Providencia]ELR5045329.1 flagellar filament capping protein FliD [Providencia rettgeri]ELR5120375.1 flagellar filament capping protein FliD [Providencia stuartii]ELR5292023.1 flagellar filament capping protein FliD [Providencia stuartii]MCR4179794.1 flagellar filament capping protein FliD [Providencia vermicola]URE77451.1 flagellar filament capping protein FliD [Providencia stuartii]
MAGIATLGIGANLDLNNQMDQIEAVERRRLEPLTTQKASYDAQISAFGKMQSSLEKLKKAAEDLKKYGDISTTKVNGEYKSFDVKTDGKAVAGVHDVLVTQLAKAQTIATKGHDDNKKLLGNGSAERTITITQPAEKKPIVIKLDNEHTSLIEIADAINKTDKTVTAAVIKDKTNNYHLVVTSKKEGTDHRISINVEGDDELAKILNVKSELDSDGNVVLKDEKNIGMEQKVPPQNALLNIDGFELESQSNEAKDLFPGLTLTLKKESEDKKPDHLIVSEDIEPAKAKIKAWVDAYNEFQTLATELTKYTPTDKGTAPDKTNGPLIGDSTLRGIQSQLRTHVRAAQKSGEIDTLNKMGIKQKLDGTLEIDNKKFEEALKENSASVKAFFMGDGKETGFGTENFEYLKKTLDTKDGTLHNATDGVQKKKKSLDKRIEQTNKQIENTMDLYRRQFQNLDKMMSSLNSTSNSLGRLLG